MAFLLGLFLGILLGIVIGRLYFADYISLFKAS